MQLTADPAALGGHRLTHGQFALSARPLGGGDCLTARRPEQTAEHQRRGDEQRGEGEVGGVDRRPGQHDSP